MSDPQFILDSLQHYQTSFNDYAVKNPIIAGVIAAWGLTTVSLLLRGIPLKIFHFLKLQLTTNLTFTNQNTGNLHETFSNFLGWFQQSRWSRWSRRISLDGEFTGESSTSTTNEGLGTVIGPGNGSHFFFYKGWPFWMHRSLLEAKASSLYQINYEISITTIGRSQKRILELIDEFRFRPSPEKTMVTFWNNSGWENLCETQNRDLDTVIISDETKTLLVSRIEKFFASEDWYKARGLPYKLVILLHGPAGGGKTSIVRALATKFKRSIGQISLTHIDDQGLFKAFNHVRHNSFIVIEDMDSSVATKARRSMLVKKNNLPQPAPGGIPLIEVPTDQAKENQSFLTLSGLLNSLDGIATLHNKIIFMSTNVPETLDPALLRKGRIDLHVYVGPLEQKEIQKYITLMFPETNDYRFCKFKPIMGCDIQDLYLQHSDDADAFINSIPKQEEVPDLRIITSPDPIEGKRVHQ